LQLGSLIHIRTKAHTPTSSLHHGKEQRPSSARGYGKRSPPRDQQALLQADMLSWCSMAGCRLAMPSASRSPMEGAKWEGATLARSPTRANALCRTSADTSWPPHHTPVSTMKPRTQRSSSKWRPASLSKLHDLKRGTTAAKKLQQVLNTLCGVIQAKQGVNAGEPQYKKQSPDSTARACCEGWTWRPEPPWRGRGPLPGR
jgi:hypothetical protein